MPEQPSAPMREGRAVIERTGLKSEETMSDKFWKVIQWVSIVIIASLLILAFFGLGPVAFR